jgi:hypothetical protein
MHFHEPSQINKLFKTIRFCMIINEIKDNLMIANFNYFYELL